MYFGALMFLTDYSIKPGGWHRHSRLAPPARYGCVWKAETSAISKPNFDDMAGHSCRQELRAPTNPVVS